MKTFLYSWTCILIVTQLLCHNLAFPQAGSLDIAFGNQGIAILDDAAPSGIVDFVDMLIQSDKKIIVADYTKLVRFNPDGSFDNTFGRNGKYEPDFNHELDWINSIANASGNKILITGQKILERSNLFIIRLDKDGNPDLSFGNEGMITYRDDSDDWFDGNSIIEQSDHKILVNGTVIVRFEENGSVDTSFGDNGLVKDLELSAITMIIQQDQKILLGGDYVEVNNMENYNSNLGLLRLNSDGSIDSSFGENGMVNLEASFPNDSIRDNSFSQDIITSIAELPDGSIVASGRKFYITNQNLLNLPFDVVYDTYEMVLCKFNKDGSTDNSFGTGGIIEGPISFSGFGHLSYPLKIQTDNKILVGHQSEADLKYTDDISISRYLPDGELDQAFGNGGIMRLELPGREFVGDIELLFGRVLAGGIRWASSSDETKALILTRIFTVDEVLSENEQPFSIPDIIVSPNPFHDILSIDFFEIEEEVKIEVYTINGTSVFEQSFYNCQNVFIDTNRFPQGIYMISVSNKKNVLIRKLVK